MTTFGVRELAPAFLFWSRIRGVRQVSTQEHVLWNLPFTKCKFCKSFLLILIHHWWGGRVYRLCSTAIPHFLPPVPSFFIFMRTPLHFLHFSARSTNSTLLFSIDSALFDRRHGGTPCRHAFEASPEPDGLKPRIFA